MNSAIIAGAVEPLKAPVAGTVTALSPRIGEVFPGGAVLFSVQDPDLDQAIGLQRVAVERARNDLESADATLAAERGRRDDYVVSQRFEIEKSAALVTDLNSQNQLLAKRCADLADLLFSAGLRRRTGASTRRRTSRPPSSRPSRRHAFSSRRSRRSWNSRCRARGRAASK